MLVRTLPKGPFTQKDSKIIELISLEKSRASPGEPIHPLYSLQRLLLIQYKGPHVIALKGGRPFQVTPASYVASYSRADR